MYYRVRMGLGYTLGQLAYSFLGLGVVHDELDGLALGQRRHLRFSYSYDRWLVRYAD